MRIGFDLSRVSTAFGAFAAAAMAAHFCVRIGAGLRGVLPPERLIPRVAVPSEIAHIALWCAVSALCVAAMAFLARHWFDRVDSRDGSRNLALRDRPEPSLR